MQAVASDDLARRSVAALVWNCAGGGGRILAQFFIQIALARMLGPEAFGQYSAVLVVLGLGWLLADCGFGSALIQKDRITDADVGAALGWVMVLASTSGIVIALTARWLAGQLGDAALFPMLQSAGVLVVLQALANLPMSLMRRQLDMKRLQLIQLIAYVVGFGLVGVLLARGGYGAWSLICAFACQTLMSLLAAYALVRHTLRPRLRINRALRGFGLNVVMVNVVNWATENLDRLLVGRFWGVTALGNYSVALNLSRAPVGLFVSSIQQVAFSTASRTQADPARIGRGYLVVLAATALLTLPLFTLVALEAGPVIRWMYGTKWDAAAPLMAAFAVATPFYALAGITGPLLWAIDAVKRELHAQLVVAVLLLVGLALASGLALSVAAWVVPLAYFVRFCLLTWPLCRRLGLPLGSILNSLHGGLVLAAVAIAAAVVVRSFLGDQRGDTNLMPLVAGGLASALCLRFLGVRLIGTELRRALMAQRDSRLARVLGWLTGLEAAKEGA